PLSPPRAAPHLRRRLVAAPLLARPGRLLQRARHGTPGRAARAPASVRRLRRLAAAPDREPRVPAAPRLLGRAPARSPAARAADRPAAADGAQLRERLRRGRHRAGGAGRPPRPGGARERDAPDGP